jgi:hypothetical protein
MLLFQREVGSSCNSRSRLSGTPLTSPSAIQPIGEGNRGLAPFPDVPFTAEVTLRSTFQRSRGII